MRLTGLTALVFALWLPACASVTPSGQPDIVIRFRHDYLGGCLGACADYEMSVFSTGHVFTRNTLLKQGYRFRRTQREVREFMRILLALRPLRDTRYDEECPRALDASGLPDPLHDPKPDDVDVRWIDGSRSVRVTSCNSHRGVRRVIELAITALGASHIWGSPAEPNQRRPNR